MTLPKRIVTVEQMELRARDLEDGRCTRRIGEHYLEVCHKLDDRFNSAFTYHWTAQEIDRARAVQIMERAITEEAKSRVGHRRRA